MKKLEPGALIAICGCLSQLEPSTGESLGADLTGGTGDRQKFALEIEKLVEKTTAEMVSVYGPGGTPDPALSLAGAWLSLAEADSVSGPASGLLPGPDGTQDPALPAASKRTRALLKIQDGCDNFCAYCIVPYARGRARSLLPELAAEKARMLEKNGFREIVITGIEISSYGADLAGRPTLTDIVRDIGKAAPGTRLRLGSLDPGIVTDSFSSELQTVGNLCAHFHLSLQSGCDDTLRRMGRKYDTDTVKYAITQLRSRFPDCGITADLITGFPGETDSEFEQTLMFIRSAGFSGMHIFPFSPRPGTPAADMPEQVGKNIRQQRARIAAEIAGDMAVEFRTSQTGKTRDVLFEQKRGGFWVGHTDNYIEVTAKTGGSKNSILPVLITGLEDGIVWGEVIDNK